MKIDSVRCMVLNASYEPLHFIPARRGLRLLLTGKAKLVESHPHFHWKSGRENTPVPTQVVLTKYVKTRPRSKSVAPLTPRNLQIRDDYTCQYCLRHKSELGAKEFLTRDHVIPRSKGGLDVWTNVVLCCNSCNNVKADLSLTDVGFKLNKVAKAPTSAEIWSRTQARWKNK